MNQTDPELEDLQSVGTLSEILQCSPFPDGSLRIIVRGLSRVKMVDAFELEGISCAKPYPIDDAPCEEHTALVEETRDSFLNLAAQGGSIPQESSEVVAHLSRCGELADTIAHYLVVPVGEKQSFLEEQNPRERLEAVYKVLRRETHIQKFRQEIRDRTDAAIAESQREYVLRAQLRCLQEELGVLDNGLRSRLEALMRRSTLPEKLQSFCLDQIQRIEALPEDSQEASVISRHLECLFALPWSSRSNSAPDLKVAKEILDRDHSHLSEAKERIVEFLAIRKLTHGAQSPVLCFEGPPGVGKTTLVESVAKALGRKVAAISLGGIRDESELRGHRRTYVGAQPGRIVKGLLSTQTCDPVILLDELDKVAFDSGKSDVASALLEILDPNLNRSFLDHYVDVPIDLGDVVFIATANSVAELPPALKDRLEVISFPSYTVRDRISIAKNYLLPKALACHGLDEGDVTLSEGCWESLATAHAIEPGVRELDRKIAAICRRAAKSKASGESLHDRLDAVDLPPILGDPAPSCVAARAPVVGAVWGLVVAPYGGDAFQIESAFLPAVGTNRELRLTGNMGAIMRESAEAAVSFTRLHFGSAQDFNRDLHIHAACADRTKEGPSAGLAIALAVSSALLSLAIPADLAVTGEITLRGQVLPVGGIREKLIASHRFGFKRVILPHGNLAEAMALPREVLDSLDLKPVSMATQALAVAFPSIMQSGRREFAGRDLEHAIKS